MEVLIPPCHPRRASVQPLTHQQLAEAIPTTKQVAARLNKQLENPITLQYIHRNYHVVKQADMVLALTCFQPESNLCFGGTGWAVEMAKVLKKVLYVYDVQRDTWFRYNPEQNLFNACDQMSEEQCALPTLVQPQILFHSNDNCTTTLQETGAGMPSQTSHPDIRVSAD